MCNSGSCHLIDAFRYISEVLQGRGGKPCCFRIYSPSISGSGHLEVGCDSESDMKDWMEKIKNCAENLQDMVRTTL